MPDQRHDIRTTCPRDCYDACGALVRVADGRVVHVRGDPQHPVSRGKLCRKCALAYNGVFLDAAARLGEPLVRAGSKGAGRFEVAGWDEGRMAEAAARGREREHPHVCRPERYGREHDRARAGRVGRASAGGR